MAPLAWIRSHAMSETTQMLNRLNLGTKFTLLLALVFLTGMGLSWIALSEALQSKAEREVVSKAQILLKTMNSVRLYTTENVNKHIKPLLDPKGAFISETVPGYSAREVFEFFRSGDEYQDFLYKEATLNPTNPRDRAVDWEVDVVNRFRQNTEVKELVGERDGAFGRTLYLAQPLQIKNPACLACHSSVDAAPQTMIDLYGTANGFGWKPDEIVGAQVVSVPESVAILRANDLVSKILYLLSGLFVVLFIALNLMLVTLVLRPIKRLGTIADQVSLGQMDAPEFPARGRDEMATLGQSFNRMRRSLVEALEMLEK